MTVLPPLVSLALSLILVTLIRKFAPRFGMVATPRPDRWHLKPTPKMGGVGIFLAFGLTILISVILDPTDQINWPLLAGAGLIFLIGVIDDLKQISPPTKLVGEIIAASIVVFFGRNIDFFPWDILNIPFTFLWLVGITNAINLLDNMDGLAGGVAFIAAALLSFLFWRSGTQDLLVISLVLTGSILGFLVFNFPPASIFMGDSGALFLGFTLASLAIARVPQASDVLAVMGVPTLLFLLPILDTTLVTITRILRGQSPAQGGRDHASHRLIAFGFSERQTILVLYGVAILAGVAGTVIESIDYTISLILIPILLLSLALLTAYLGRLKVVKSDTIPRSQRGITSLMVGLTFRGRMLEVALDLLLISIAYYLAFFIHFGSATDIINLDIFLNSLPIALGGTYLSFLLSGIYRGVWQYVGIRDIYRYAVAVIGAVLSTALIASWVYQPLGISLRIFVIFAILLFLGLAITRSSFKLLDQIYTRHTREQKQENRVLIYGADNSGIMTLQWLTEGASQSLKPVGFLDRDPYKRGRQILGVPVLGSLQDLDAILEKTGADGIILSADTTLKADQSNQLKRICQEKSIWIKKLQVVLAPAEDL